MKYVIVCSSQKANGAGQFARGLKRRYRAVFLVLFHCVHDLSICCAHRGGKGTDESAQALITLQSEELKSL